jgi:hypothetical protein
VIFARASSLKSSTVRHKLDLGAVVAVCWKRDRREARAVAGGDQADLPAYPIGVLTSARKGCDVRETGLRPGSRRFPVFGSSAGSPPCESVPLL